MVIRIHYKYPLAGRYRSLAFLLFSLIQILHAMPYPDSRGNSVPAPYQPSLGRYPPEEVNYRHSEGYADDVGAAGYSKKDQGYQGNKALGAYEVKGDGIKSGKKKKEDDDEQTETKYYYGGKFTGSCTVDGLYYRDDSTFVICSNGYPHAQPCPPGTRTAGYPRYKAGYYYGYTDLCSVNLVDFGYGPEYYAPRGHPKQDEEKEDEKQDDKEIERRGSAYSSSSIKNQDDDKQGGKRYENYPRPEVDYRKVGRGGYGVDKHIGGERDGKVSESHYSNHLGQNKQGGAAYGEAKGVDIYPEYPVPYPVHQTGYSRNSGPPDRLNYRNAKK